MTEKEFTQNWVEKIKEKLKSFPDDFIGSAEYEEISLPGKILFLPPPFFDSYQITNELGETIFTTDDHFKAKYVLYANRLKPPQIKIPKEGMHVYETVRDYEKHLDSFLKEMEKEFKQNFPNSKGFKRISIQVFNSLNLTRQ
ncbi:MAG: hypothetical protein D4R68_06800 [Ignavibacteriales bacterium]|nr:MAG: hypothetical protein D4R68_06800 [Ignavibacteriales bacterium]